MNCPVCKKPLIVVERNNVEVDYCLSCKGFWLDKNELEVLNIILGIKSNFVAPFKHPAIQSNEKKLICPYCNAKMKKIRMNGAIIDVCPNFHGMWFDKGELPKILNNANSEQSEKIITFLGETFKCC